MTSPASLYDILEVFRHIALRVPDELNAKKIRLNFEIVC